MNANQLPFSLYRKTAQWSPLALSFLVVASAHVSGAGIPLNLREALSAGDLDYTEPATRSEEGMPVGNGKMGSLVWTTPSALKFQINRVDVFGMDASTTSFPAPDSDYASGCGYVDINVAESVNDVFTGQPFKQHLSVYDGLMTAQGAGLTARVIAWHRRDVMAVEIDDQRPTPEPVNIDLRMLRYTIQMFTGMNYEMARDHAVIYKTANHYATSRLEIRDGQILLTQRFAERDFFDSSAVAIGVVGRPSKARYLNEFTVQLAAAPGRGKFTILIASAATFDRKQDVGDLALKELAAAQGSRFEALLADNTAWWHAFWTEGFVGMHSADGQADFVGGNYAYFMYLMGSSSRGDYPPRFGGMLWYTCGDMRRWGSQYWWANTSAYYSGLMASNHKELMDPFYKMYFGMYDACALAARQQWGSKGIWIPEITFFSGPEKIPDNLVQEFQDLYLARKPYEQASKDFLWWVETKNRHNSRYNFLMDGNYDHGHWVVPTKGQGIFGHCTHILASGVSVARRFYDQYEYTLDDAWLRDRAYPMIKGMAEFYRNFPNVKKEADGKYHIYHVNSGESNWDSNDTRSELSGMQTACQMAIRVSQRLGVDADLRPLWQDIASNIASPGPGSGKRGNFDQVKNIVAQKVAAEAASASGLELPEGVTSSGGSGRPTPPQPSAADKAGKTGKRRGGAQTSTATAAPTNAAAAAAEAAGASASATAAPAAASGAGRPAGRPGGGGGGGRGVFGSFVYGGPGAIEPLGSEPDLKRRFLGFNGVGGWIDPVGGGGPQIFRNRLRLREGPGAIDAEHIGGLSFGIHQSLLVSSTSDNLDQVALQVFPAWPKEWDVRFKLLARGAFEVTASQKDGKIQFVELKSPLGGACALTNPWGEAGVIVYRNDKPAEELAGASLLISTTKGETVTVVPRGSPQTKLEIGI